uniref:Uncharacterized protein n=1 Tax=Arundo donax TaxID=35708 RepID=A0A0A9GU51_ARUDO
MLCYSILASQCSGGNL